MLLFELTIALLFLGAVLSAWARRARVPYPALLALAGAGLGLLPNTPAVALDPELALALFVAPVLVDAAFDASPRDLKKNWVEVVGLALGAVIVTVVAVAGVARLVEPKLPWAAAIALGAIVAPPDAAAATAVLKQLRLPRRLIVVLEGESLFNDASALLIYRVAVAAAAGTLSGAGAIPALVLAPIGSVLLGLVLARVLVATLARFSDAPTAAIAQFVSTFAVWLLAERLHLSGIITVVVYGIAIARTAPDRTPARIRIPTYAVWEVAVFVFNVLAFILVGLQVKPIVEHLSRAELVSFAKTAACVCVTVIVVRVLWTLLNAAVSERRACARLGLRPRAERAYRPRPEALVTAWCGMRGIVTLAAALALPDGVHGAFVFPYRGLILLTAFSVVLVTLVVQGMTLTPLIRVLSLEDDHASEREERFARRETARAGLAALADDAPKDDARRLLERRYELRLERARSELRTPDEDATKLVELERRALQAERRTLSELRAKGAIGDDAFHRIEEELDLAELHAEVLDR